VAESPGAIVCGNVGSGVRTPLVRRDDPPGARRGRDGLARVDRAGALREVVVAEVVRGRLQDRLDRRLCRERTVRSLVGLVDQCGLADCDGRRAAGTAPGRPGVAAVDHGVQRRIAGRVRAVGDDVDPVAAVRARAAVRPLDHVVVGHLRVVGDRVPAGRAEARRRADLDAADRRRSGDRPEARSAVARREERRRCVAEQAVEEVGLGARGVHPVVVELRRAVGVGRHLHAPAVRQEVPELLGEPEREVDVAHRGELRVRRAAEHHAGDRSAVTVVVAIVSA